MLISNGLVAFVAAAVERPLFSLDGQTLINIGIQLVNACVLAVALRFILYKPVQRFMKKRADAIKDQMNAAEDSAAKAEELKALYERKLDDLEQERYNVLDSAKAQAEAMNEKMIDEMKNEIADMKALAENSIKKEREQAEDEMKQYIIDIASYMAEKVIAHSIDESVQNKLFEESLSELETVL